MAEVNREVVLPGLEAVAGDITTLAKGAEQQVRGLCIFGLCLSMLVESSCAMLCCFVALGVCGFLPAKFRAGKLDVYEVLLPGLEVVASDISTLARSAEQQVRGLFGYGCVLCCALCCATMCCDASAGQMLLFAWLSDGGEVLLPRLEAVAGDQTLLAKRR